MVPLFFIEERLSIYNSQFGEEASGIPMFRGREKRGLNPSRFASTESLVSIRHDKRRAYLFDRANASSLETREGLPFATGTFAIFRDVIVAQHEFYFSLRVTHTESASKVSGSRRPRSFQVILFKSLLRLKLFELKNINRNIKFLAIYFTLPKTF